MFFSFFSAFKTSQKAGLLMVQADRPRNLPRRSSGCKIQLLASPGGQTSLNHKDKQGSNTITIFRDTF
jgi:hypothetical protein